MDEKEILELNDDLNEEVASTEDVSEVVTTMLSDENDETTKLDVVDTEVEENSELGYETVEEDVYRQAVDEDEVVLSETPKKKAFPLQKTIIIASCILLAAIIAFGGLFAYNKIFGASFEGTWVLLEQKDIDVEDVNGNGVTYFIFDKDGKTKITIGNMSVVGEWSYNKDTPKTVDIDSYYFSGTFTYELEGDTFNGKSLKLSNDSGEFEFYSSKVPEMHPKKNKDAKIDTKILGTWKNENYSNVYTFYEDGTCFVDQGGMLHIDGYYSVSDDVLTVTYIASEETDAEMPFAINDDGTISIDGLVYKK